MCVSVFFFFFQAEDGIRDLVRSRGLGDVYKRQRIAFVERVEGHVRQVRVLLEAQVRAREMAGRAGAECSVPVSYTHLTLPTSDLV